MSRSVGAKAYEIVDKIANNRLDHLVDSSFGRGEGVISKARITRLGAAALAALMLMAAGCGDDDDDDGGAPAGGGGGAEQSGDQSGGAGEQTVTDYVDYIGGKAGKADPSKPEISIGWLNQEGGQTEIGAAATDGADLAVKVVNEQLGGIGGHPGTPQKSFIKKT